MKAGADELEDLARAALPQLEQAGDHAGLVHVWSALGYGVANARGRYAEWAQAAEQAFGTPGSRPNDRRTCSAST